MDAEAPIIFSSRSALREFVRAGRWLGSRGPLVLDLPDIGEQEQAGTQRRLNFWRKVCGCQLGALLMIATLVWRLLAHKHQWSLITFAGDVGIAFAMAMLGKLLAIAGARLLLLLDLVSLAFPAADGVHGNEGEIRS